MESLPPMAAHWRSSWADRAPSRAATGLPQRSGAVPSFSKYSWKESQHFLRSPPAAMTLATDSATAR